jgi:hypothetical protein
VDNLAVGRVHRLERAGGTLRDYLGRDIAGKRGKRLAAPLAVAADVDVGPGAAPTRAALERGAHDVLHCLQGRAPGTDEQAEVLALDLHGDVVLTDLGADRRLEPHCPHESVSELRRERRLHLDRHRLYIHVGLRLVVVHVLGAVTRRGSLRRGAAAAAPTASAPAAPRP